MRELKRRELKLPVTEKTQDGQSSSKNMVGTAGCLNSPKNDDTKLFCSSVNRPRNIVWD